MKQEIVDAFWKNVNLSNPYGCWEWHGSKDAFGYGRIWSKEKKTFLRASRISWEIHHGDFDRSLCVCHHCDNTRCVNPNHLFLGTAKDNADDRERKNRNKPPVPLPGEKNPAAKLKEEDVIEILRLHREGVSYRLLSQKFGVCQSEIGMIITRKTWAHLTPRLEGV